MKYILMLVTSLTFINTMNAQQLNFSKIKIAEQQLDDVMELIDTTELKIKLKEVEQQFKNEANEINKTRLGIIYHETALNLSFFSKTEFKGYAKKSFDILSELVNSSTTTPELLSFITSYRASSLSLVGAETKKLSLLGDAFKLFKNAVKNYSDVCYLPEFLRGSVAENLPWLFFSKRKAAKHDFESIISKYEKNNSYANSKIMSFTYWAWANKHQDKKHKKQAVAYLDKAIALDTDYKAGRKKAEGLKLKLTK